MFTRWVKVLLIFADAVWKASPDVNGTTGISKSSALYYLHTPPAKEGLSASIGDIAIKRKRAVKRNTNINMAHNARTEYREFGISNSKINLFMLRKPRVYKHKRAIKKARIRNHSKCWYSQ